ncbi:MAG: long-chain fatty acid--CoA ligase [Chloroflexi bacterium]|nr:long-chain fatty acid--CoA ligase [Chloroflexota bacterium]
MTVTYDDKPWLNCYDDYVPHSLAPYPEWSVPDVLARAVEAAPDVPAVVMSADIPLLGRIGKATTYAQLQDQANALAAALLDMGLAKGDRVALFMPNCTAFVIAWYAVLRAGMVVVGTNPTYPPARLAETLRDSGSKAIITLSLFYDSVQKIRGETPLEHVIVTNIKEGFPPLAAFLFTLMKEKKEGHRVELQPGDHALPDLLKRYAGRTPTVAVTKDDVAIFQYTGGTTGPSKAAVATQHALVINGLQQNAWLSGRKELPPGRVMLAALPFYHSFGMLSVIATSVITRATMAIVINARDIDDLLGVVQKYRPMIFPGVPALYNAINAHPDVVSGKIDLSSIEHCISGSAPLPQPTKATFERLSGAKLVEGYGMSEAPTATHANPLYGENRTGSIGLPLPDMHCRIVSPENHEEILPVGEVGELTMTGPHLMLGYHERPTETANVIYKDAEGRRWLLTGDIGYMSEDGYFFIVDRKKDMALIGGFNVYPNQNDQVLNAHPAVAEVAVGVIPHPEKVGQEALKAWVVAKPGMSVTQEDLINFASERLARYEIPKRYEFVEELPRSAVGKILRRQLVQDEIERQGQEQP